MTGNSLRNFIMEFERMGITVYLNINILEKFEGFDKQVTMYGSFPVISFCAKTFEENKMLVKRAIDIAGAIVGLLITAVITVFVAPAILIESPGPLFLSRRGWERTEDIFTCISSAQCIRMLRSARKPLWSRMK